LQLVAGEVIENLNALNCAFLLALFSGCRILLYITVVQKTAQSLWHHNFRTVRHRVMWFSAKCSERNFLRDES